MEAWPHSPRHHMPFKHLSAELLEFVRREVDMQSAVIDRQLAELGFAPPKDGDLL